MIREMPSFKAEEAEPTTKETQRKSIWEKMKGSINWEKAKNLTKVAAFVLLANVIGVEIAKAQETVEDFKGKTEQFRKDALSQEKILFENVKEKGQREGFMGQTPTREWITPDSSSVRVGYETSAREKPSWIVLQNADASYAYYDAGADGDVDRVIINKHNYKGGLSEKKMDNYMCAFPTDMDGMAYKAKVVADLMPKDVTVFDFDASDKKVQVINYNDGSYIGVQGSDSEDWIVKSQEKFVNSLDDVTKSIE